MKKNHHFLQLGSLIGSTAFTYGKFFIYCCLFVVLMGCKGTCPIITRFEVEPEWVCPGKDFSPKIHIRIEKFDQDGNHSDDGMMLWGIWETSNGAHGKPGSISLLSQIGNLNHPTTGVWETPPNGVHVLGGPLAQAYNFTLVASNSKCKDEGNDYIKKNKLSFEAMYGVDLDDNEPMTAYASVELVDITHLNIDQICAPHVFDVGGGGYTWVKNESRAGNGVVIKTVENYETFQIEVRHTPSQAFSPPIVAVIDPQTSTNVFDGRSPNGLWEIKVIHQNDYNSFINNGFGWSGKPSLCLGVGIECQPQ